MRRCAEAIYRQLFKHTTDYWVSLAQNEAVLSVIYLPSEALYWALVRSIHIQFARTSLRCLELCNNPLNVVCVSRVLYGYVHVDTKHVGCRGRFLRDYIVICKYCVDLIHHCNDNAFKGMRRLAVQTACPTNFNRTTVSLYVQLSFDPPSTRCHSLLTEWFSSLWM